MISESDATMSPQEASPMKPAMSVRGIDMAKRVFHAVGMDERGKIVLRKRLSRHDLIPLLAKLPVWSKNSCSLTLVVFQEASEPFTTRNGALTLAALAG